MKINGRLQLDIFKTIDGKKIKIGNIDEANLITLSGKQVMAYLMAGEPGTHKVSKFGVGEGSVFPDDYDTGLTNGYIRHTVGYNFLDITIVQWEIALDVHEANGKNISEFGLYSEDEQLFARKIRTPAIPKDASVSFSGAWTVWLMECKKTTFFSYVEFDFSTSLPSIDHFNSMQITPVIEHNVTSDGNSERVIAAQGDIVTDITSSGYANKDFTSTGNIVSSISDPTIDFTNVERRFFVSANYFHEVNDSLIFKWGEFASQVYIISDINDSLIFKWGEFASQGDVISDITSDGNTQREFASTANIVSNITSDIQT